jgi:putative MATE family efflux protein
MKDRAMLLTSGPIGRTMVLFAMPLVLGNFFQQMYNTVDSLVVGNFIGSDALAAVASSGHSTFLVIGFLQGVFVGAGVVIARYFGAQNAERVKTSIHTTVSFALLAGLLLSFLGIVFSPWVLRIMGTPESVMPSALVYFRIYFAGLLSAVLYNCANGILQALGDSRHPLYYLIFSSVLNVALDLVFVIAFGWGVAGVAWATVFSQAASAALGFWHLARIGEPGRFSVKLLRLDLPMLKSILHMGIPAGMQNSIIAFANMVVQSHINSFGAMAVAGSGTFLKLEGFAFIPISSFALSITTFVSQNIGAGQYERAHSGARFALITSAVLAEILALVLRFSAPLLIGAFNSSPEVIRFGVLQAMIATPFYFLPALSHCMAGILRGLGRAVVPMIVMLVCWCVIRVTYLEILMPLYHDIRLLYAVYPFTWCLSAASLLLCYRRIRWDRTDS